MSRIIVTGCGTNVGKTLVAAIVTESVEGSYWKPIESGCSIESDTLTVKNLVGSSRKIFKPIYQLSKPYSPHRAAAEEGILVEKQKITPPVCCRTLVMETAGGIYVPLNEGLLAIDLFKEWKARWIVVSRHYLGSINHTLLTLKVLQSHGVDIAGIIFNGDEDLYSERSILFHSQIPCLGRLANLPAINQKIVKDIALIWRKKLCQTFN